MKDWAKLLSEALASKAEKVPKGFKTAQQIAKENGISETGAGIALRRLMKSGKVEKEFYRIQLAKKVQKTAHYRLKK